MNSSIALIPSLFMLQGALATQNWPEVHEVVSRNGLLNHRTRGLM
jgi:hypothetical protein